jgi:hypothetical protein
VPLAATSPHTSRLTPQRTHARTHARVLRRTHTHACNADANTARKQVHDTPEADLSTHFTACFGFIAEALAAGGGVFIHCFAGRSRSVTVLTAFLMRQQHLTLQVRLLRVACVASHGRLRARCAALSPRAATRRTPRVVPRRAVATSWRRDGAAARDNAPRRGPQQPGAPRRGGAQHHATSTTALTRPPHAPFAHSRASLRAPAGCARPRTRCPPLCVSEQRLHATTAGAACMPLLMSRHARAPRRCPFADPYPAFRIFPAHRAPVTPPLTSPRAPRTRPQAFEAAEAAQRGGRAYHTRAAARLIGALQS